VGAVQRRFIEIIILISILLSCSALYSCRNISAQDFGPDDIANILEVILSSTEYIPEPIEYAAGPAEHEDPDPDITDIPDPTDLTDLTDLTDDPAGPDPEPTEPVTQPAADPHDPHDPYDAYDPADIPEILRPDPVAAVINIESVFPEVPEKFAEIPFPEAVRMTDSLKQNITDLADFSPRNFNGIPFYIATTDSRLFTPLYNGGMLSDARRYRTKIVDAECGVLIESLEKSPDAILHDIRLSITSDEFMSDIVCVPFSIQSELIRNGYVMNLRKVPFLNLNAEYFNASATDAFTVNGNIYGLVSDFTFDPSSVYAMYFNRDIIKRHNLTNPAELHKEGKWDFDAMFDISKEYSALIDLAGLYAIEFESENTDIFNGLFMASGNRYFTPRNNNFPILNYNNERTIRFINAISRIFQPSYETAIESFIHGAASENPNHFFEEGAALFSMAKLDLIPEITNARFDWGLLPVPVTDASGPRYSFTDNSAMSISVLRSARNTEACGIVVSALSMTSHRQLKEIYKLEQMMYHLRDVDSVNVLGEIVNNLTFSQYNAFPTIPEVYSATAGILKTAANNRGVFADLYDGNRRTLNDFFRSSAVFERR
jgi:hypothetical protein